MKKIFVLTIMACFTLIKPKAQNVDLYKFYLKSGMILKGELIQIIPDSIVKLKQYGLISTIKCRLIDSIVFEESKATEMIRLKENEAPKVKRKRKQLIDSAWHMAPQIGYDEGSDYEGYLVSMSVLKGAMQHMMYGACFGLDIHSSYYNASKLILGLIDVEGRYFVKKKSTNSVFIDTQLGYGFNFNSSDMIGDGGPNAVIGLGNAVRTKSGPIFSVIISVRNQLFKDYDYYSFGSNANVKRKISANLFEVKLEWRI